MKTNVHNRRGFTLVELLVVIVIIASLAAMVTPSILRGRKRADQAQAINNAKQLGTVMFEFDAEYGSYPDASTAVTVAENNPDSGYTLSSTDSNDYFVQLFASGLTQSEDIFYAKTGLSKKPDGVINSTKALEAGENGFGYIMNGSDALSSSGNPARVLLLTPLNADGTTFNKDPFDKVVALRLDTSVASLNINGKGEALLGGGKKLLDGGADSIWGASITPTIVPPKKGE